MKTSRASVFRTFFCGLGLLAAASQSVAATVSGSAIEVGSNIQHPNGNVYDQVSLRGVTASVNADAGQVTRVSLLDINDDIVQIEFSGRGTLTVSLDFPEGPMAPTKYYQPGVAYMRGLARISIVDPDASTNVSVFSVGRANALNPALFPSGVAYDGWADIAAIEIAPGAESPGFATFGGIRAGNALFVATQDRVGIYADNVHVQSVVNIHDIQAADGATPYLWFGDNSQFGPVTVAGGDLRQLNGRAVQTRGFQGYNWTSGRSSHAEAPITPGGGSVIVSPPGTVAETPAPIPVTPVNPDISVMPAG